MTTEALDFYAYWNGAQVADLWTTLALITGTDDYRSLLLCVALFGLICAAAGAAVRYRGGDLIVWIAAMVFIFSAAFVPRVNIAVRDVRSANVQVVQNIPLGIGWPASVISRASYWLTESFETAFGDVDAARYTRFGVAFPQRVVTTMLSVKPITADGKMSLTNFTERCIVPEILENSVERSELRDWEIFSQHPRFMELYQKAAIYLKTTVPNPEETESVTWQCALCNEKSLQGAIRWVIKIRCGATVTFEIFHYSQAKYQYFVNIAVAPDLVYEAIDSQKPGQQYLPFANLCLPPRRQPPTLKDLQINGVFRKEGTDEDGPNAQAELLTRPIALVDTSSLGMLTVPFDALESVLEDDVIATAAAMANIACMRTQLVESADHNSLLAFRMLYL